MGVALQHHTLLFVIPQYLEPYGSSLSVYYNCFRAQCHWCLACPHTSGCVTSFHPAST
jgi:hypothetical protein